MMTTTTWRPGDVQAALAHFLITVLARNRMPGQARPLRAAERTVVCDALAELTVTSRRQQAA
jgi:hypothetical protein